MLAPSHIIVSTRNNDGMNVRKKYIFLVARVAAAVQLYMHIRACISVVRDKMRREDIRRLLAQTAAREIPFPHFYLGLLLFFVNFHRFITSPLQMITSNALTN